MSALAIIAPGAATTLQDLGRWGHQAEGVPVSGALDPVSLRLANALVGNPPGAAALELRLLGPTIEVAAQSVCVAFVGAENGIEILAPEKRAVPPGHSVRLTRGAVFRVGALRGSATGYLAVGGGFDAPELLGSRSTYLRGGFGGFQGRALRAGDRLPLARDVDPDKPPLRLGSPVDYRPPEAIRVVLGPQDDHFRSESIATFLGEPFVVTRESDRMGLRLAGLRLAHVRGHDIVSDGIATGAIQVPGDGQPIVLLADHQTTGGYPKIATVISADLPALGRVAEGARLRFAAVSVEAARAARAAQAREIAALVKGIVPARIDPSELSSEQLLAQNLIGGVVGADPEP